MCGFAGFVDERSFVPPDEWPSVLRAMGETVRHRGPDDDGRWSDPASGVGFAFRRLSILDLSPAGHQPMMSRDDRFVLMFNGEIYNFVTLRSELESLGHPFRGRSDTEVMLAAFTQWGVLQSAKRFNGMFAFAVWDRLERSLMLVRDRIGEKPLYYGHSNGVLLFGSQLTALRAHPAFNNSIDREALDLFLRLGCVPAPFSIFEGIRKVPPATAVRFRSGAGEKAPDVMSYWSVEEMAQSGQARPFGGNASDALSQLDELVLDSVRLRMVADVPLGAFLSGGIDSSLITSAMQRAGGSRVKTFSIGFGEGHFNEAPQAAAVARYLGTDHTEGYVSPGDALAVIPDLPYVYDEPFADPSQIPTLLVSKLARRSVTVSLSGDGGDELFGGYNRYIWGAHRWRALRMLPRPVRHALATLLKSVPQRAWERLIVAAPALLRSRLSSPGEKMHKLAKVLTSTSAKEIHTNLMTYWQGGSPALGVHSHMPPAASGHSVVPGSDLATQMMFLDLVSYLPDVMLVKLDRASMAVSLEARVPLLDPRIVEFAFHLPTHWKIRGSSGKWLLRQLLYKYVPRELVDRPKMGFTVPLESWLRGPLRDWAESLLEPTRMQSDGYLDSAMIRARWKDLLAGRGMAQFDLWNVLMFQAWAGVSVKQAGWRMPTMVHS